MDTLSLAIPALITISGLVLSKKLSRAIDYRPSLMATSTDNPKTILYSFTIATVILGLISIVKWYNVILNNSEKLIYGSWLLIFIIAGMFVQVASDNYKNNTKLFKVTGSQISYPLLFSVVVFYPTWLVSSNSTDSLFPFYAAFLNGYYWRDIVSSARAYNTSTEI